MFKDDGGVGTVSSSVRRARSSRGSFVRVPWPAAGGGPNGLVVLRVAATRVEPLRGGRLATFGLDRFEGFRDGCLARPDDWRRAAVRRADALAVRPSDARLLARFTPALR